MTPEMLVRDGVADKWLVDPRARAPLHWPRHWPTSNRRAVVPTMRCPCLRGRALDAAPAHRLCQLQPRNPGPRCRVAGAPGGLPLHGGGHGQHVSAHRPRGRAWRCSSGKPLNRSGFFSAVRPGFRSRSPAGFRRRGFAQHRGRASILFSRMYWSMSFQPVNTAALLAGG